MWQRDKSEEEEKNFLIRVNRFCIIQKYRMFQSTVLTA